MFNNLNKMGLMGIILSVLILLFFSVGVGECGITTALGNKNSSGNYRMTIDTDGIVTFQTDTAINFPYQSGTTNDTLTAADSGRTYVIGEGTDAAPFLRLPAAVPGMVFPFISSSSSHSVYIIPNGTDIINYASLVAGDSIYNSSAAKGDSITLICTTANQWDVDIHNGTWADGNSPE